jgi:hypothetical protein
MNDVPPGPDKPDELDDLYRRASALDPSRPSELVRQTVLARAAELAALRAAKPAHLHVDPTRAAGNQARWRPAVVGTLAAAALAGLLIAPHFLTPTAPPPTASQPAQGPRPQPAATLTARAPVMQQAPDLRSNPLQSPLPSGNPERRAEPLPSVPRAAAEIAAQRMPAPLNDTTPSPSVAAQGAVEGDRRRVLRNNSTATLTARAQSLPAPRAQAARAMDPAAALRRAAELGDLPALHALLEEDLDIDARDGDGRTALMLATLHGRGAVVDALLASGADPNAADAHGTTPLQAAAVGDQPAIVAALRRSGGR